MKKKIALILALCMLVSCFNIMISATDIIPYVLQWDNIISVIGDLTFTGRTGCYGMVIRGADDVDSITATATLYYKNANGNWIDMHKDWTYSVEGSTLTIDENFIGVTGREYKVELEATVYVGNDGEPVSDTAINTCP